MWKVYFNGSFMEFRSSVATQNTIHLMLNSDGWKVELQNNGAYIVTRLGKNPDAGDIYKFVPED